MLFKDNAVIHWAIMSLKEDCLQIFFFTMAGNHLTQRLRRLMFQNFLQQELSFFDEKSNSTGALCSKLSGEAALVQGATGQRIGTVVQAFGTVFIALVLALFYEWRVGLVSLCFVPLISIILYKESNMIQQETFGAAKSMQNSSKIAVEAVANIRTVATIGREALFVKEYEDQLRPALLLAKRATHWRGIVFGLARGVYYIIYAASMFYGGHVIVTEGVPYDLVLKAAQALLMGSGSAAEAFAFAPNFQKGINAAGRIIMILNRKSKILDPDQPVIENFRGTGEAKMQSVQFSYPTRPAVEVLKGLDLEIPKGQTVALVGSSGCGKSTVIQLLERFYDADAGLVALDGASVAQLRLAELRRGLGLVQQEPVLFDRTIGENIAYGDNSRTPAQDEIIEAARQANIHNFVMSLPMGYDTNIGSKGTQLSGGQKQRVAIARALVRKPQILLLDEATSALDTESEKIVQEALDVAKEGRTCITIAHRLSTIRDADVICVIHAGRVAERGTHQELIDRKGLYYRLYKQAQ
ncbi:Multidrug resistance protein 1 [Eumeta japonica]|uniref:ABC-type xenobiotic transporter n=1 Tax=Eumeta variegata TaxID=151549 RepID=A0A4C1X6J5_EUMVA|nr:Multidrug resistance protein 1 [Eumeta japonica]